MFKKYICSSSLIDGLPINLRCYQHIYVERLQNKIYKTVKWFFLNINNTCIDQTNVTDILKLFSDELFVDNIHYNLFLIFLFIIKINSSNL